MSIKSLIFFAAVLAASLLGSVYVEALSCQDCLTNVPYQSMPGCAAYDSKKDMSLPPTDLAKKCNCEVAAHPESFNLCNTTCSQSLIDYQKDQVGIMKFMFSCKSQGTNGASHLTLQNGILLGSAIFVAMQLVLAL
ncbi:hypothetical protein K493DRAFT_312670 [Basidiobolus meristosporus CBS 931.73]|uniref:Uncharacterized protein n=1 Tax=Basidiobolus meristosporus CBS 931.73 TaxID=1314790 RepID=A0A1Y1YS13_9FUNG|nr:hypothetical protein K493DRAFT_312670 [Basidiobolus meristosporus CBS 931.73]|eukprot:ORY00756.1 hypothetical protein K493DRAFT_312670 [Basidiobolus meristosporus CBS 931.73]